MLSSDVILFADGFESGSTDAWSSSSTDTWSTAKPLPLVASFLARPQDEVEALTELKPYLLARVTGDAQLLLVAIGFDGSQLARVEVRRASRRAGYELRALAKDATGSQATSWITLGDGEATSATVELEWRRAIGAGANGGLLLLVDGRELAILDDLTDPGTELAVIRAFQPQTLSVSP